MYARGGRFTLSTSADTDARATADGSAVQPPDPSSSSGSSSSDTGGSADTGGTGDTGGGSGDSGSSGSGSSGSSRVAIGVAVAVNYAVIENKAILPANATVIAKGATLEALIRKPIKELVEELDDAIKYGAQGIGLYRSEFLYISKSPLLPTEAVLGLAPVPGGWQEAGPDRLSTWLQAAKRVVKCGL